jgi:hypothetical protein
MYRKVRARTRRHALEDARREVSDGKNEHAEDAPDSFGGQLAGGCLVEWLETFSQTAEVRTA